MLSIGKLNPSRASYYAAQLPGGDDEYYTRGETERPAVWLGSAAERLGLAGRVEPDPFRRLLDAAHPHTGDPLGVPRTTDRRLAGFDLCFSAPKSVSVAWALSPLEVADAVAAAHDRAVAQAVDVFEAEVARARRGKRAAHLIETDGVVAAAFGHLSSRAGDPQLHTHVVIPNLTVDSGGRWSALAGDRFYRWAKTLGYLYQGALRAELTETLGVSWGPVRNGTAEITGIDPALCEVFSTRRAQIAAAMEQSGGISRAAAEIAALATRPAKTSDVSLDELRTRWRERAKDLGHDIGALAAASQTRLPADRTTELAVRLLSPDGLTTHDSSFDRRDLLQALAAGHPDGIRPTDVTNTADRILERDEVVSLAANRPAGQRYTTADLLRVETDLVDRAARPRRPVGIVAEEHLASVLAERPTLTDEQEAMVTSLATSGAPVEVVVGRAGAGKTYALDAARAAWQAAGHQVIGAALAARAAAELESGSGIPSTTVDRLLADLDRPGPLSPLGRGTIVVVDEAAMVGTRKLARLLEAAEQSRTQVVLVGDPRQLPEVEAGGAFAALAAADPVELTANRRQAEQWERDALDQLRHGDVTAAVTVYRDRQRITLADSAEAARQHMVTDWWAARADLGTDRVVMIALHQADVDDLNRRARLLRQAAGELTGPGVVTEAGRAFAAGDEVLALRNDRRIGIHNGTRATVVAADPDTRNLLARLGDGRIVTIPAAYLDGGQLTHGYAITAHKAQGLTTGRAFVLGTDRLYREAGYTALSRAVERTDLYQVQAATPGWQPATDAYRDLTRALSRSGSQTLASHPGTGIDRGGLRDAALSDPGPHLIDRLGPPPPAGAHRDAWAAAAVAIDTYRQRHGHHGPDPLGAAPADKDARRDWEHAKAASEQLDRLLTVEPDRHLAL